MSASTLGHGRMVVGFHNYLCNQCLSSLMLSVRTPLGDKVCQWLAGGRWYSPGTSASSTTKSGCHDITEILQKVALNTRNQSIKQNICSYCYISEQQKKEDNNDKPR
jgi:hypothetical protein